ncbi:MAG: glycosyltransferase family 9 protein [Alphaproteobacteria bacterium]
MSDPARTASPAQTAGPERRVLVIKLGALGDFVQAMGPFAAIRRHHAHAHVVLLTTAPYAAFAAASPWFDEIWLDDKPRPWRLGEMLALRSRLREGGFDRVYDLQTSDRSSWYFRLMGPGKRPEWSGIARGCSHPHANPRRDDMHTLDRQAEQLAMAGLSPVPAPDLSWAGADVTRFGLEGRRAVLLVPGGAPHRPDKRWPAGRYADLALSLTTEGLTPVILGTSRDQAQTAAIAAACPRAVDLSERTSFLDIVGLARLAAGAVGNDTGPMHLVTAAECPSLLLYSSASDPALCAQRGPAVTILRRPSLAEVTVAEARAALRLRDSTTPSPP